MANELQSQQLLTFTLDGERFAVEIAKVREVLEFTKCNRVPRAPPHVRGMINLRGNVVPVIDLRLKLGLSPTERTVDTCVIITQVTLQGEPLVLGALADSVQEVIELESSAIEPAPRMGTRVDTRFIRGIGKRDDQFLVLLDIERVLTEDELLEVAAVGGSAAGAQPAAEPPAPAGAASQA
jgi:chemotaxis signal transduction protein